MARGGETASKSIRKLVAFDFETWQALHLFARDSGRSLGELVDEAFRDLLEKHRRPVTLTEALRASARRAPANDRIPARRKRRSR